MTLLFDGDWVIYRACFSGGNKDFIQTVETADFFILDVFDKLGTEDYKLFLTSPSNFRYEIDSSYKANRKQEKPKYFYEVRDYVRNFWNGTIVDGLEADDLCGLHQSDDTIIVGEDKDLLTIPGRHYRIKRKWSENHLREVGVEEAKRFFYCQMLTGDSIDNIEGLKNPAKSHFKKPPKFSEDTALALLEGKSEDEMRDIVQGLYREVHGDRWFERYDTVARLLFIRRADQLEYY